MGPCEICGNAGANPIRVITDDSAHVFDCFECAIHAIAPRCDNCGCRIIGHGVSTVDSTYCCDHCRRVGSDDGLVLRRDGSESSH